jgi:hypothetical protein
MLKVNVTDKGVIDSPPSVVYKAILNEYAGVTHWWMPFIESKLKGDIPATCEGAIFNVTAYPKKIVKGKFSVRVIKLVKAKSIELEYAGVFEGTGIWTFDPTDEKTEVNFHFNVRITNPLASLFSPFINVEKQHSDVMQKGFLACNNFLRINNNI